MLNFHIIVAETRLYFENQSWLCAQANQQCNLSWHDCAKEVLSWTDIPECMMSSDEVGNYLSGSGRDFIGKAQEYLDNCNWNKPAHE